MQSVSNLYLFTALDRLLSCHGYIAVWGLWASPVSRDGVFKEVYLLGQLLTLLSLHFSPHSVQHICKTSGFARLVSFAC